MLIPVRVPASAFHIIQIFHEGASALVYFRSVEIGPLALHLHIGFKFRIALTLLESHFSKRRQDHAERNRIEPLVLVLRLHGQEKQVNNIRPLPFECLQQMPPSEWEHASAGLLQGP